MRGGREGRADGRVPVRMLRARSGKWRGGGKYCGNDGGGGGGGRCRGGRAVSGR